MEKVIGTGTRAQTRKTRHQHPWRVQHRRGRLGTGTHLKEMRLHGQLRTDRGFELPRYQKPPPRGSQPRPVPPVDQLHRRDDGDQVRHSVAQSQLHRDRSDQPVAAPDRKMFRRRELEKQTEEVIARETARIDPVLEQYRKICRGKTAFAFVGGSAEPPLPVPAQGPWHGDDHRRLRVCPPRRLRRPPGHPDHQKRCGLQKHSRTPPQAR